MSPELEKQLIEKYPILFRDVNKSPKETCMCWGIEAGSGWYDIIDNLCGYITHLQEPFLLLISQKRYQRW